MGSKLPRLTGAQIEQLLSLSAPEQTAEVKRLEREGAPDQQLVVLAAVAFGLQRKTIDLMREGGAPDAQIRLLNEIATSTLRVEIEQLRREGASAEDLLILETLPKAARP